MIRSPRLASCPAWRPRARRPVAATLAAAALAVAGCDGEDVVPPPPPPPAAPGSGGPAAAGDGPAAPIPNLPPNVPQPQPTASPGLGSNYGTVTLAAGFNPDPHVVEGTTGPEINAATKARACEGWIARTPDHVFVAATDFPLMRLVVNGGETDTTLVVERPDGTFLCDDDGGGARQPVVAGTFAAGSYKVWVGTFSPRERAPYRLGFSELPNTTVGTLGAPGPLLAVEGEASFGTVELAPGFMPDPHVAQGRSGGTVDASTLGEGCQGWISPRPDHLFVAREAFEQLHVLVRSPVDTTLVLRRPDGTYACDDDAGGERNPTLVVDLPAGTYPVWIGSYEKGEEAPYRLGFSGRAGATPDTLPDPTAAP